MIAAIMVVLLLAGGCFAFRLWRGPTVADRVIGLEGLLMVGVGGLAAEAMRTRDGVFVSIAVVTALVSFIGTAVVARYIEARDLEDRDVVDPDGVTS